MKKTLLLCGLGLSIGLNAQTFEYSDIKIVPSVNKYTDYALTTNSDGDAIMVWRDVEENKLAYKRFSRAHDYTKAAPAKLSLRDEPHEILKLSNGFNMVAGTNYLVVTDPVFKCCSENGTNKRGSALNEFRTTEDEPSSLSGVAEFDATADLTDVHFLEVAESPNGQYAMAIALCYSWDGDRLAQELNLAKYSVATDKITLHRLGLQWEEKQLTPLEAKQELEMEVLDDQHLVVAFNNYDKNTAYVLDYQKGVIANKTVLGDGGYMCDFFTEDEVLYYVVADDDDFMEDLTIGKAKFQGGTLVTTKSNVLSVGEKNATTESGKVLNGIEAIGDVVNMEDGYFVMAGRSSTYNTLLFSAIDKNTLEEKDGETFPSKSSYSGSIPLDIVKIGDQEVAVLFMSKGNFTLSKFKLRYKN